LVTTLITGASGGIGLELAHVFARHGHPLILVARTAERLAELARTLQQQYKVPVEAIPLDLGVPGAPAALQEAVAQRGLTVEILVNNAGFGLYGPYLELDGAQEQAMIQLNVAALTDLTKRFLPGMVERGRGGVLNVASTAAFQPGPGMAVYYATKAYVLSFSEALHHELQGTGVTVTALCPGPTRSGFQAVAGFGQKPAIERVMMEARPVAEEGYEAFMKKQAVRVPGLLNKIGAASINLLPRRLAVIVSAAAAKQFK
jgi:short-subunit dehydrogenase